MKVTRIRWTADRVQHIARHSISPEELDEAVFDDLENAVQVLKKSNRNPRQKVFRLLGRTDAGGF